jgi:LPXTG-site transpeptidase (sortase) family protein
VVYLAAPPIIVIVYWQWVLAAFFVGITLTFCLEIRRRQQIAQLSPVFYFLPVVSLLLAGGIWLTGYEPAATQGETAVFLPQPQTTPSATATFSAILPSPQISRQTALILLPTTAPQETQAPQMAVLRLSIPVLNLNKPIHTIPLENGIWNVADLGSDVGWLETTAVSPEADHAMVFVGHMTYANNKLLEQGAFADIPNLPNGTAIILDTTTGAYTYHVDSVRRVSPDNADVLYQESGNTILLLTCADWNPQAGIYENRLLVRAVRDD